LSVMFSAASGNGAAAERWYKEGQWSSFDFHIIG